MLRALALVPALVASLAVPVSADTGCGEKGLRVPGAARSAAVCLTDLTTAGTVPGGHTDPADWAGLEAPGTVNPSGVPGIQIDGYFPDSSKTNVTHGWNHDSQFVIRLPRRWNGGLVVSGPPGVREQYANDRIIGDHVLARGYAFAATDKGNTGSTIYKDGRRPGDAIQEWHWRLAELTRAAKRVAAQRYGRPPRHTYVAGLSAGGYLVRGQLERFPSLYSGGVDWNALFFAAEGPSLLTTLPPALRAYPRYAAGKPGAREEMLAAGYPAGSEPLWEYHHKNLWDFLQRIVREELDPSYDGPGEAGTPFCQEGSGAGCDTDYRYESRPREVHAAVRRVSLTGRIARPLISVQGTLDVLTPSSEYGDVYAGMVRKAGREKLHRYYRVPGGTHTDGLSGAFPGLVRPMQSDFLTAFDRLVAWTQRGVRPE
ncbi:tannase/feruloyl esterase [Actinomadura pelletieri DSM 43383]|uniref:Tannase/feruloyl esterase n=1 Tax=Actinomadura pelletieri DSM 43383 TaxID=1120940 RepID=A0A495QG59_9ACTN|nr:tannase/feruloyl esterase [Actinomadura pelletieri DSM 43383]